MHYSSINPLTMFYAAGIVGKSVILLLLAASIYTWVLVLIGAYSIVKIRRSAQSARAAGGPVPAPGAAASAAAAVPASGGGGK